MSQKPKEGNKCCQHGCDCPCCACKCPYCTLLCLVNQLKDAGVCPDVAAKIAADFVAIRCDQECK